MTEHLPVPTSPESPAGEELDRAAPPPRRQPMSVAFLPLALVTFVVLSFVAAAWTFLAATGA